jgi:hypothetical protein
MKKISQLAIQLHVHINAPITVALTNMFRARFASTATYIDVVPQEIAQEAAARQISPEDQASGR